MRNRVTVYIHDTFLITRTADLGARARLYMAPQFQLAVRNLKHFFVNSEKTRADLLQLAAPDAVIQLYRPSVANHFALSLDGRVNRGDRPKPLRLVSLGTIEPRKNYSAALAILDALRASFDANAELHIIGRPGWGEDAKRIPLHPGVTVHGYLDSPSVKNVMENADLYLCTSHDEGLGLPLLEAQFAGLPVVAPDQPVFREVLGSSGIFIDPASRKGSAQIIENIIGVPGWRASHAHAALANVTRWNATAAGDLAKAKTAFSNRPSPTTPTLPGVASRG
jgi:glycosyltransferase involved in cell wall biosynthesis